MSTSEFVLHKGGCHCGQVKFEVLASPDLFVYNCNCSVCTKKQNRHFIVPKSRFKLIKVLVCSALIKRPPEGHGVKALRADGQPLEEGEDYLTTYTFNTHRAKHMFCRVCGVQSFYQPRSNPDGYGVMPHCLDAATIRSIKVEDFDGTDWERSMDKEAAKEVSIHTWSQPTDDQKPSN